MIEPVTEHEMCAGFAAWHCMAVYHGWNFVGPESRAVIIMRAHAKEYGITVSELKSPDRTRRFAWPRQDLMARLRRHGMSKSAISRLLNRDHTTIIHGIKASNERAKL